MGRALKELKLIDDLVKTISTPTGSARQLLRPVLQHFVTSGMLRGKYQHFRLFAL